MTKRLHTIGHFIMSAIFTLICIVTIHAQKWDTLAPVPLAMTFPVVAVLDGQIHIMGGGASGGATKLHYAYDPASDTWTSKAPVPYFAQQPAGAANNGLIHYFGGGYPNSGTPLKDHYTYSPDIDSWTKAADLTSPRAIHNAVSLDGTLYSLGGQGVATLMQIYNSVSDEWVTKNPLPDASFWYGAHVAAEGNLYRFGGGGYTAPTNKANQYDPATDTWTSLPNLPNANHSIKGAAIGDKIYLTGGYHDFLDRDEMWIYDTKAKTYTAGTKLPIGRSYHNMATIDSCIYVIGGNNAVDPTVSTQLLRFCPYESTSSVKDPYILYNLRSYYANSKLTIWIPSETSGFAELIVTDELGRNIMNKQNLDCQDSSIEIINDQLSTGIYFLKLSFKNKIYQGKVFVNR